MGSRKRKIQDSDSDADLGAGSAAVGPGSEVRAPVPGPPRRPAAAPGPGPEMDSYFQSLYSLEPSFSQLGKRDAAFASFLGGDGQLDFKDPAAVMQLTKTLLMIDFGLRIELPNDRLCPPSYVPNRHNYILWLKGLLDTTSYEPPGRKLHGIDIGTGASCIYPLLGAVQRPWYFTATDIDPRSLEYAKRNVQLNGLGDRVQILDRSATGALLPLDDLHVENIDFVMMNPPFYSSEDEMASSARAKQRPPNSVCTGAPIEMVCEGGEVAYVGRMLSESLIARERVQWYTAMLGKATSVEVLVRRLRENGIDNFAVTEFVQGNKTRRWALGWSFRPMRPSEDIARGIQAGYWRKVLPPPSRVVLSSIPAGQLIAPLIDRIIEVVGSLELVHWSWEMRTLKGIGRASENVWGRAWRRKKLREAANRSGQEISLGAAPVSDVCQLGFEVKIEVGKQETIASLSWREGYDRGLFESLFGFLQDKLKDTI